MNIRFSNQTIRLRITKAESMLLLAGEVVETSILLEAQTCFFCQLHAQNQELGVVFRRVDNAFYFELNRSLLLELAKETPSKEGLTYVLAPDSPHPLKIVIEVDVFVRGHRNS